MLNSAGMTAQFKRSRCAISRGILKASVDAGKTLSRYVLDMVDPLNEGAVRNELTAVEEQLNRFGGRMSYEERTALKIRRSELRKELGL